MECSPSSLMCSRKQPRRCWSVSGSVSLAILSAPGRPDSANHVLPWIILSCVEKTRMTNFLSLACITWAREGKRSHGVIATIQSYTGSDKNGPTWMLMGLTSTHIPCKDPHSVMEYFSKNVKHPDTVDFTLCSRSSKFPSPLCPSFPWI